MDTIYIKVSFLAITIQEGELVLVGDFSENYSFVVQDAVQGYIGIILNVQFILL